MVLIDWTKGIDMRMRTIGALEVSAVGLGAMGFSPGYGPGVGEDEAIDLMRSAFDLGCTFYDTAESYAAGENERLVSIAPPGPRSANGDGASCTPTTARFSISPDDTSDSQRTGDQRRARPRTRS